MQSIKQHAIDGLNDLMDYLEDIDPSELHHRLFNEDYFVIGVYNAKQFIRDNEVDAFDAIGEIQEYEQENFGEVTTDLSDVEKVVNMYVYIKGYELLRALPFYIDELQFKDSITKKDIKQLIKEIEEYDEL